MNETDYKTAFVKQVRNEGWYGRRIEDKFQVGVPDLWIKPRAMPFFIIEAKIVDGYSYAPSARQLVDLQALHEPPNTYAIVLGIVMTTPPTLYWSEPREIIDIRWPQLIVTRNFVDGIRQFHKRMQEKL